MYILRLSGVLYPPGSPPNKVFNVYPPFISYSVTISEALKTDTSKITLSYSPPFASEQNLFKYPLLNSLRKDLSRGTSLISSPLLHF